jgi:hypothetical protein
MPPHKTLHCVNRSAYQSKAHKETLSWIPSEGSGVNIREGKNPAYNISHNGVNIYFTESRRWQHCFIKLAVRCDTNMEGGLAAVV